MTRRDLFLLPGGWTRFVRTSAIHAVSLAFMALTRAWGSGATSRRRTTRLLAELDRANTEIALLKEELGIKDTRWSRIAPRRRPYYRPVQRMRILKLKAARGWSASQTAEVFAITEDTVFSWLKRIDEEGERALVQLPEPVNKFPEFVGYLVCWLKSICPTMGKVRIAQVLARAGLRLGATTVGRMLKEGGPLDEADDVAVTEAVGSAVTTRVVTATHPDHVWHVDLTVVPTTAGFWIPWIPLARPQRWPFCWWVAVVIDHFSRRVNGFAVFTKSPTSVEVCEFLDRAVERTGRKPKHIVTDRGSQFDCDTFRAWCGERGIRPRYGAVGKQGSIAVVERFLLSLKTEHTRRILVPFGFDAMRREIGLYAGWYNEHRPHQALGGMTPSDQYAGDESDGHARRVEPRPRWPVDEGAVCVKRVELVVKFVEGRKHLPIVELKRAA